MCVYVCAHTNVYVCVFVHKPSADVYVCVCTYQCIRVCVCVCAQTSDKHAEGGLPVMASPQLWTGGSSLQTGRQRFPARVGGGQHDMLQYAHRKAYRIYHSYIQGYKLFYMHIICTCVSTCIHWIVLYRASCSTCILFERLLLTGAGG